jgi:uncharacterized membrane protein
MSRKHVQWLLDELPKLTGAGVVPEDVADRLRAHYSERDDGAGVRWAVLLFGILGGALIGGGIILLLAHNWDELSRPVRAVLSFVPLVAGQALATFVLLRKADNAAWREGVAAYWAISVGASISLVAQTYNISGDFGRFVLAWTLLALPIVYLLDACLPALLYLVGITVWTGAAADSQRPTAWFWVLAALLAPYLFKLIRQDRYQPRVALSGWVLAACLCVVPAFMCEHAADGMHTGAYGLILTAMYAAGAIWFGDAPSFWKRPLQTTGNLGIVIVSLVLTFDDSWHNWSRMSGWAAVPVVVVWLALPALTLLAGHELLRRKKSLHALFAAAPALIALGQIAAQAKMVGLAMALFNAYLAAVGVVTMTTGLRAGKLGVVNAGMGILALLIVTRFFDSDMSFVVRGLGFIAVGCAFLIANVALSRKKGTAR